MHILTRWGRGRSCTSHQLSGDAVVCTPHFEADGLWRSSRNPLHLGRACPSGLRSLVSERRARRLLEVSELSATWEAAQV